ncbi:MAG: DMT family transporter [Candidatus Paceibacterota bacterium]
MDATLIFLLCILPATVLLGAYEVLIKKLLNTGINERFLLSLIFGFAGVIILIVSSIVGFPEIKDGFLIAFIGTSVLNTFAMWFWYRAIQQENVSIISPIRLISSPLILLTSFFILGEKPNIWGIAGVFIIVVGLWLLLDTRIEIKKVSFKKIAKYSGIWFAFLGAILFAFSFPLDKQAVVSSSSLFSASLVFITVSILNFIIGYITSKNKNKFCIIPKSVGFLLPLIILVFAVGSVLALESLNYSLAGYASSVKRLSVLWAVIFSGVFLQERKYEKRIMATIIMLLGLFLMVFFG